MKIVKVCVIGCGNISNSRHIPALKKNKSVELVGVLSDSNEKIQRTITRHAFVSSLNQLVIDLESDIEKQLLECSWFMKDVDAVVIGTPPKQHFKMTEVCLKLKKHVLVEKPMMMSVEECNRVIQLANSNKLIINVMHSFQYSNGMMNLKSMVDSGELGELKSILELQLSNRDRRLPLWYNDLPLGLFYDEAAHFFYSARKFGGQLKVLNANGIFNDNDNTPRFLQAQMLAGDIPVQMYMNFNSPICEWGIVLIGTKKIAIYDYFKDILIVLNNDGQHLAKNILKNSLSFTYQFWKGFIINGFKMISGKLLYGHDVCISHFVSSINDGNNVFELSAELGLEVVSSMNEVVNSARKK